MSEYWVPVESLLSPWWVHVESLLCKNSVYLYMHVLNRCFHYTEICTPPACPTMLNATCRSSHFAAFTSRKNWVLWEFVANTSIKKQTKSAKCGASSGLVIHGLLPVLKSSPSNEFHQKNITIIQTIYMLCMRFNCLSTFIVHTHMNAIN